MLPIGSQFPNKFDDDSNLLLARDYLKVRLGQDYNPGDRVVSAESSVERFPPKGIITLIDHCDPQNVTSLYYTERAGNAFGGLALTEGTRDSFKSKLSSVITQQLDALHHNNIAAAVMAIEQYLGTAKDDKQDTLFGRLNYLKKVALAPKAWIEADITVGLAPLTVTFISQSSGTSGPVGQVLYAWDFGDGTKVTTPSAETIKTYQKPGIYPVALEVTNTYGSNKVVLQDFIRVRPIAPEEAKLTLLPQPGQHLLHNSIRTTVNQIVMMEVPESKDIDDPVVAHTWEIGNGEAQRSAQQTKAVYETGGLYDISVRRDSKLGAFRITHFPGVVDVIEPVNLWLWLFRGKQEVSGFEYGLLCETFKTKQYSTLPLGTKDSFLDGAPNEEVQKKEFAINNLFVARDQTPSGFQGEAVLLWASGRDANESPATERVLACTFNAFLDMYSLPYEVTKRPWNWAGFTGNQSKVYLIGGAISGEQTPGASLVSDSKSVIDFDTMETTTVKMHRHNFLSGSQDFLFNHTEFDQDGEPLFGHFSRHRTTWLGSVGYMLRDGDDNRLKSFYKTDGTIAEPFINITKLLDLPEPKAEGQLLSLNESVYFFSSAGDVFAYNDYTNTWEVGDTHAALFHESGSGTFLAASDKDRRAYISYGSDAFVKYNALDSTFTTLGVRPGGDQWLMSVY